MRENYVKQPPEVEVWPHGGGCDIILRRNIEVVTDEDGEYWECEERQIRLTEEVDTQEVSSNVEKFWAIAGGETTLDELKKQKVAEMSAICNKEITKGIDIVLSDGETHHFSLSVEDQTNINSMFALITSGDTMIPYHANGEKCIFFTAEEFGKIVDAAMAHKTFHLTYYNSLRDFITAMTSSEEIQSVKYGMEIPEQYQSDVLKQILAEASA